jgi:hypothetical protein
MLKTVSQQVVACFENSHFSIDGSDTLYRANVERLFFEGEVVMGPDNIIFDDDGLSKAVLDGNNVVLLDRENRRRSITFFMVEPNKLVPVTLDMNGKIIEEGMQVVCVNDRENPESNIKAGHTYTVSATPSFEDSAYLLLEDVHTNELANRFIVLRN